MWNRCASTRMLLSRGLDEPLSKRQRARLVAHLGRCPACARVEVAFRRLRGAAQLLREVPRVPSVAHEVCAAAASLPTVAHGRPWMRWAAAGVAVVGLVAIVLVTRPRWAEPVRPSQPSPESASLRVFEREHAMFSQDAVFIDQAAWSVATTTLTKSLRPSSSGG